MAVEDLGPTDSPLVLHPPELLGLQGSLGQRVTKAIWPCGSMRLAGRTPYIMLSSLHIEAYDTLVLYASLSTALGAACQSLALEYPALLGRRLTDSTSPFPSVYGGWVGAVFQPPPSGGLRRTKFVHCITRLYVNMKARRQK